jgi:S-adenosylmethionine/arginine decarboxylase-like enzyme
MTDFGALDVDGDGDKKAAPSSAPGYKSSKIQEMTLADEPHPPARAGSWGYHLLMDMSECNDRIDSVEEITGFFGDIIEELGMTPLSPLMIKKVSGEEGRGVSAVQMITTSSITFHSDDDKRSVYLDVFSCKDFDPKKAEAFICKFFRPKRYAATMIYRDAGLVAK